MTTSNIGLLMFVSPLIILFLFVLYSFIENAVSWLGWFRVIRYAFILLLFILWSVFSLYLFVKG